MVPSKKQEDLPGPDHNSKHHDCPLEILELKIVYVDPGLLKPDKRNPRTHNRKQRRLLERSIKRFGFYSPAVVDENNKIIAGHGRWLAAMQLGMDQIPIVRLDHLTADERRALALADNQLAKLAGWDDELLKTELGYLISIDFDVELTGFEMAEIDMMLEVPGSDLADGIPVPDENQPTVARLGDHWVLGEHHVVCGDARDPDAYKALLGKHRAQMIFTDVPYNVRIQDNVSGKGAVTHGEFVLASGEMTDAEFVAFLERSLQQFYRFSKDGSVHQVFIDWRNVHLLTDVGRKVFDAQLNLCVWNKTNAGMGSLYRSQHELVGVFKKGTKAHINNVELGRHGRNRSNVWTYAGVNTFRTDRDAELAMHPTVKPVALVADAIRDCSKRNGLILDPFLGSGTTIIAAEETGRRCYGLELDPKYVDVILGRWRRSSGEPAVLAGTGQAFDEVMSERLGDGAESATTTASPSDEEAA